MAIHKRFYKGFSIIVLAILYIVAALEVEAQGLFDNPINSDEFDAVLTGIANFIMRVGLPVIVLFLLLSGFMFIKAQGNEQELQKAKTMFYWVIVGTTVVLGAGAISLMVINFAKTLSSP